MFVGTSKRESDDKMNSPNAEMSLKHDVIGNLHICMKFLYVLPKIFILILYPIEIDRTQKMGYKFVPLICIKHLFKKKRAE